MTGRCSTILTVALLVLCSSASAQLFGSCRSIASGSGAVVVNTYIDCMFATNVTGSKYLFTSATNITDVNETVLNATINDLILASGAAGDGVGFNVTNGQYLYNISNTLYFNESMLNATCDARDDVGGGSAAFNSTDRSLNQSNVTGFWRIGVNTSYIQVRVQNCSGDDAIQTIAADGTVTCQDTDSDTNYYPTSVTIQNQTLNRNVSISGVGMSPIWTTFYINQSDVVPGDINITGYSLNASLIYGDVGGMDLRGNPWYIGGTGLEVADEIRAYEMYVNSTRVCLEDGTNCAATADTNYYPTWINVTNGTTHRINMNVFGYGIIWGEFTDVDTDTDTWTSSLPWANITSKPTWNNITLADVAAVGYVTNLTDNDSVLCSNIDGEISNLCTLVDTDTDTWTSSLPWANITSKPKWNNLTAAEIVASIGNYCKENASIVHTSNYSWLSTNVPNVTVGIGLTLSGQLVSHFDASAMTNFTATSRNYITNPSTDGLGHILGYSLMQENLTSINNTNVNFTSVYINSTARIWSNGTHTFWD